MASACIETAVVRSLSPIENTNSIGGTDGDACNLLIKDLAKSRHQSHLQIRRAVALHHALYSNDIEAGWFGADRALLPLVPEAIIFRGVQPDRPWCAGWGFWYYNPNDPNAVKPPDGHWIWNIWKIWDEEIAVEPDPAKQTAAFKNLLDIWATELPFVSFAR